MDGAALYSGLAISCCLANSVHVGCRLQTPVGPRIGRISLRAATSTFARSLFGADRIDQKLSKFFKRLRGEIRSNDHNHVLFGLVELVFVEN